MDISFECHGQFYFFHDFCTRTYELIHHCFCHTVKVLYAPVKTLTKACFYYMHKYYLKPSKIVRSTCIFMAMCVSCIVKVLFFIFLAVVEILDSDSESDDPIYKFKFDIEDLITSTLNEFGGPERDEESPQMTETLNDLNGQIKGIESMLLLQNTLKLLKEVYFR